MRKLLPPLFLSISAAWAQSDCDAIRARLAEEKPCVDVANRRLFNHTVDPLPTTKGVEFLGSVPTKTSREVTSSILSIGYETLDRKTFDPKWTFPLVGRLGVKHARCQTGWNRTETVKGRYDFAWLDEVIDGLAAEGIRTWLSVGFGNPLYTPCPKFDEAIRRAKEKGTIVPGWARGWVGESPWYHGPEAMEGWLAYVRALARHTRGRVTVYELWNEPEFFWCYRNEKAEKLYGIPKCAEDFTAFARVTADAIRRENPEARFAFNLAYASSAWMPALRDAGIGDVVDIFCYHGYGRTVEETPRSIVAQAKALFRKKDGTPVAVWQGESGRPTDKSRLFAFPTPFAQAKFIARRVLTDFAEGAELSNVFTVTDFLAYYEDGSDQYYGIIDGKTHQPKLGYYTLQALAGLFDGLERAPEYNCIFWTMDNRTFTSQEPYAVQRVALKRRGIPLFAWWRAEHIDISTAPLLGSLRMVTEAKESPIRNPILIDPVRRTVWDVRGCFSRGDEGIDILSPAWALDYPLILTDLMIFKD